MRRLFTQLHVDCEQATKTMHRVMRDHSGPGSPVVITGSG